MPPAVAAAGIAAAGAIGGGVIAANGAKKAANAQLQAAANSDAAQERIFDKQTQLQEPFRQGGMAAQNRLLTLLGIAPSGGSNSMTAPTLDAQYDPNSGSWITVPQSPNAMANYGGDTASPDFGKYARDFGMSDFQQDPGYSFRLSEGLKALDRSAAARGGLQSGGALKAAERYGQDLGSQEYQNAFNRYQINRSNQLNPLQSLMGAGQSSVNTLTTAAGDMGRVQSENALQAGNARASGYIGGANALTSALSTGINAYTGYQNNKTLNAFLNGPSASPAAIGYSPGTYSTGPDGVY